MSVLSATPSTLLTLPFASISQTPKVATSPLSSCSPISRSSSQRNLETDSGKSCSPARFDCSFDSGISVLETKDMQLQIRIQQCQRILVALQRDEDTYRKLRERLAKITQNNLRRENDAGEEQLCNVCCEEFEIDDKKSFIACCTCNKRICRVDKCAHWLPETAQWECRLCHSSKESLAQTCSWVAEQMSFNQHKFVYPLRARSEIYIPISDCNDGSLQFESVSQVGVNTTTPAIISAEQKLKIREYVEEVVAQMLGGTLNNITVGQMSKSENYLQLFYKYHTKLSRIFTLWENALCCKALQGDLPAIINNQNASTQPNSPRSTTQDFSDVTESRLRQMIESIVAETMRLSSLTAPSSEVAFEARSTTASPISNGTLRRHRTEHYFEPKMYQDLLATAVLNKIADKQQKSRNNFSESTPELNNGHIIDADGHLEHRSSSSNSSIEPRSEYSYTRAQRLHKLRAGERISPCGSAKNLHTEDVTQLLTAGRESALSDYLASHMVPLPDLSAPPTESEEDDYISGTSSIIGEGGWEDNWLFKKKRTPSVVTANSIGMLVPAPKEDIRAQIGDKTTDEVSDLSEIGSDTDDNASLGLLNPTLDSPNGRLLNKHIIGGQNTKLILDELIDSASMISNTLPVDNEPEYTETRNLHALVTTAKTEAVNESVNKVHRDLQQTEEGEEAAPLPGSIAEREYKKWHNAVEMPNNPYAPDALKKRISGSQERFMDLPNISPSTEQKPITLVNNAESDEEEHHETDYRRYSRDYYINETTLPTIVANGTKNTQTSDLTTNGDLSDSESDDIIINEVIRHSSGTQINRPTPPPLPPPSPLSISNNHSNCHWTLSTPVRRSSSLKYLNDRYDSQQQQQQQQQRRQQQLQFNGSIKPQCGSNTTSPHFNDADEDDDDNIDDDLVSHRSWKSNISAQRRPHSSLSINSFVSLSSATKKKRAVTSASILSQFEKQLLHKDLKRNSFRAISATTKDFVVNPMYERELNLSLKPCTDTTDEQVDSGVDSCLNGFSELDAKDSNNSLLF